MPHPLIPLDPHRPSNRWYHPLLTVAAVLLIGLPLVVVELAARGLEAWDGWRGDGSTPVKRP